MNRNLNAAAAVLGLGPRKLRARLRELGILDSDGKLASGHRGRGYLFVDTRSFRKPSINGWKHYGVVMVTERGIGWLAQQLGIPVHPQGARSAEGRGEQSSEACA